MTKTSHGEVLTEIRYNRFFLGICTVLAALSFVLSLLFGNSLLSVFPPLVSLVFCTSGYLRPNARVFENAVVFYAVIGPVKKVYEFSSLNDLELKENTLFVKTPKKRQSFRLRPIFISKDSIQNLREIIAKKSCS